MQVWANVHEHVRANLHACRQMSLYAYVLIACIYVRSSKITWKLLFTPVICFISYISVTYSSGGPCASGQEPLQGSPDLIDPDIFSKRTIT